MIFVLTMLFTFVYDRKNENHWSLLVTQYSLLVTHYSEYKHPKKVNSLKFKSPTTYCFNLVNLIKSHNFHVYNNLCTANKRWLMIAKVRSV